MKKICMILLVLVFVTIFLPFAIVFVMDKTVDNGSLGSDEVIEEQVTDNDVNE